MKQSQLHQVLDLLDHTFAVELDRRRRIRWVSRSVAARERQDPVSYRGCRPEDLWPAREEYVRAFHDCLRRQEVLTGFEVWTGRGDVQRIVRAVRVPTGGGVVAVGEDVTERVRSAALWALLDAVTDTAPRTSACALPTGSLLSGASVRRLADITNWPPDLVIGELWRMSGRTQHSDGRSPDPSGDSIALGLRPATDL